MNQPTREHIHEVIELFSKSSHGAQFRLLKKYITSLEKQLEKARLEGERVGIEKSIAYLKAIRMDDDDTGDKKSFRDAIDRLSTLEQEKEWRKEKAIELGRVRGEQSREAELEEAFNAGVREGCSYQDACDRYPMTHGPKYPKYADYKQRKESRR